MAVNESRTLEKKLIKRLNRYMAKRKKLTKGGAWPVILFIGALLFASYIFNTTLEKKSPSDPSEQYIIEQTSSFGEKETVQLGTVKLIQLTPTPLPTAIPTAAADTCNHDMSKKADPATCKCTAWLVKCEGGKCVDVDTAKSGIPGTKDEVCKQFDQNNWCQTFSKEGDGWYCIGKPVIYLYPQIPTLIDVRVATDGEIFISDPPIEYGRTKQTGGWKSVLALPSGTLLHQGKTYRELFYESVTRDVKRPAKGIVMNKTTIEAELLDFITQLGLTQSDEQQEFLQWWIPQLKNFPTQNIFVSILEEDEKRRLDQVFIQPKPDTFIEFIAYFAPLPEGETVEPLVLPPTPPRIGFTAIEWGGVVDPDPQF